jgi:hypothetical protein
VPDLSDRGARRAKADLSRRSACDGRRAKADLSRRSACDGRRAKADRRFAWWLVWLYPPAFRRDVGLGLVDALDDRMRARRASGSSSFGVRLLAIADTIRNAPQEWLAALPKKGYDAIVHEGPYPFFQEIGL